MSKPVFVLITAKTCGACMNFKKRTWDSLKKELEGKVQIVTIELPTTQSKPDPQKYHKDLSRFIGWFPTMSLFPSDRWFDPNSELIGIVKNGKLVPPSGNTPEHVKIIGTIDLSKEDILRWVDYTLANDKIFTRNNGNKVSNKRYSNGNFMVPTAAYYSKFRSSKVE